MSLIGDTEHHKKLNFHTLLACALTQAKFPGCFVLG